MASVGNSRNARSDEELDTDVLKNDSYETAPHCVRSLLMREPLIIYAKKLCEPTCGRGVIVRELKTFKVGEGIIASDFKKREPFLPDYPYVLGDLTEDIVALWGSQGGNISEVMSVPITRELVKASDLRTGPHIYGTGGVDFLDPLNYPREEFDAVVMNPPFGPKGHETLGEEIVQRALEITVPGGHVAVLQRNAFTEGRGRFNRLWSMGCLKRVYQFVDRVNLYPEGMVDHNASGMMAYSWFVFQKGYRGPAKFFWIDDKHDTWGEGGLLPQQVGVCNWCGHQENCFLVDLTVEQRIGSDCEWMSLEGLKPKKPGDAEKGEKKQRKKKTKRGLFNTLNLPDAF